MTASKTRQLKQIRQTTDPENSLLSLLLQVFVGMLLVVRLLAPTESAADGDTLWIAQFWLGAALLWAWNAIRENDFRVRLDRFDLAFCVVVVGHVISALSVLYGGGQKRAAINMMWEWVGLGVCFFVVRQVVQSHFAARRLVTVMLTTSICLAALGLWQHYYAYPQMARKYDLKSSELQRLEHASPPQTPNEALDRSQRIRELRTWFIDLDIPLGGSARALWEKRLRSSSEPFGMFALANTFAGLLLVWLIVGLGVLWETRRGGPSWQRQVLPIAVVMLMAFCLILTKSRTAGVGLVTGLAVWGGIRLWTVGGKFQLWARYTLAGCLLLLAMLTAAASSGGFDLEVISEAPKSLRYRLQYWTAAGNVIWERPVMGTGPGNFRQHYLRHKLPESSEEIADPHNLVLDLWASGGIVAVIGLIACIATGLPVLRQATTAAAGQLEGEPKVSEKPRRLWDPLTIGACAGFAAVFLVTLLAGDGLDYRLPALMVASIAVTAIYGRISNSAGLSDVCLIAAFVALLVHLLGASGIEMPAIVQTLLVLFAVASVPAYRAVALKMSRSARPVLILGGLFFVLFVMCLLSATVPVLNRRALVAAGDQAQMFGRGWATASRLYDDASVADPFSPTPARRLSELNHFRWELLPDDSTRDFDRAVKLLNIAIGLDPHNYGDYRRLGEWSVQRFERTNNPADAAAAVNAFRQALDCYPTHAALRAELAIALDAAGDKTEARNEAISALRQDALNHRQGHRDKFLPWETMKKLSPGYGCFSGRAAKGQSVSNRN